MLFFFFNDTATTEIYTLSLHDALPIFVPLFRQQQCYPKPDKRLHQPADQILYGDDQGEESPHVQRRLLQFPLASHHALRSEEHTSELQSRQYLVCRLLLEKKKITIKTPSIRSTFALNVITSDTTYYDYIRSSHTSHTHR